MIEPIPLSQIKSCPFCGSTDMINAGQLTALTMGVECRSCLATIERRLTNDFPEDEPDIENTRDLKIWILNHAITMWNKRAKP